MTFSVVPFILQLFALLFLFFAAFNLFTRPSGKPQWGWLALFLILLSFMINGAVVTLHQVH